MQASEKRDNFKTYQFFQSIQSFLYCLSSMSKHFRKMCTRLPACWTHSDFKRPEACLENKSKQTAVLHNITWKTFLLLLHEGFTLFTTKYLYECSKFKSCKFTKLFMNHDIFHIDTRPVKRIQGCVAIFILLVVA